MLHEDLKGFFQGFPRDAHPMPVLSSAVSALSTFYQDSLDPFDQEQVEISTIRLLAKLPTIAAYAYKKSIGQPFLYPDNNLTLVENFLRMTFGVPGHRLRDRPRPGPGRRPAPRAARRPRAELLDLDGAARRAPRRPTSSPRCPPASTPCSGPLHGGANQAVLEMLERIQGAHFSTEEFMTKVKNKEDGVRLMGFGHRVYKNYDPRAAIIKNTAHEILAKTAGGDQLLEIAMGLEEIALADDYFIERKLYPNVDFYTGLIYKAMGFPTRMFTVLFALGRLPGWIAQWREMMEDPTTKIGRPRQVYVGEGERDYVPVSDR